MMRRSATFAAAMSRMFAPLDTESTLWAVGSMVQVNRLPFSEALFLQSCVPPYDFGGLPALFRKLGLHARAVRGSVTRLRKCRLPCLVELKASQAGAPALALLVRIDDDQLWLLRPGDAQALSLDHGQAQEWLTGYAVEAVAPGAAANDPDALVRRAFDFTWFIPALLRHKHIWRDVLIASLAIQLIGLATPLFTQVVIDKVVVHQTTSTLIAIGVGLLVFMVFSGLLTWLRQLLILHTGNRIDARLGTTVFEHLLHLPLGYFEHRPTGVIAARLAGVETLREFVASSLVTLLLDLPFLLIFVAIMLWYSLPLSLVVLAILGAIALLSLLVAPLFRARLDQQFLLLARNQAFVTEYVASLETVKSLQMEPQLTRRYQGLLADALDAGFATRQLANTYSAFANGLEQLMGVAVLVLGAWIVMHGSPWAGQADANAAPFTIGMLVAFQMFASRLSQPLMRLVGLWQQFQQARVALKRMADIMDAPREHHAVVPRRVAQDKGRVEIVDLGFRYAPDRPWLVEHFNLVLEPGTVTVLAGPSGSGKSTLAKLLQGFYQPGAGLIRIDGVDAPHLGVNELRSHFGVVPQETALFSGSVYDNLCLANPHATFEQVVSACRLAEIHDTIEALPQGYQTPLGERGVGLSGGQKQRLAIARAMLKQPGILIFDEATSALDAATAEHFAQTVNGLRGRVTVLFITHHVPASLRVDQTVTIGAPQQRAPVVPLSTVVMAEAG